MSSFRGDRLKQLRKNKGLRQEDVAIKLGLNRVSYAHYESNKNQPPSDKLSLLVDIFNTNADYLLGKSNDPSPSSSIIQFDFYDTDSSGTRTLTEHESALLLENHDQYLVEKALDETISDYHSKDSYEGKLVSSELTKIKNDYPEWATSKDKRDLKRIVDDEAPLMFDGIPIDEKKRQQVIGFLNGLFWEAKEMNKKTYGRKKKQDESDNE